MTVLLSNNGAGSLASSIVAGATSITLQSGEGARFPSPSAGDWFPVTLLKSSGQFEICRCTARSGDVLTITRAQEGTTAIAFTTGDRVELRLTSAALDAFVDDGVVDASDAAAGKIGEVITATRTVAISQSNNVRSTVTQITLTPGDWEVHGLVHFGGTSTDTTFKIVSISLEAAVIDANYAATINQAATNTAILNHVMAPPMRRVNITADTIVYLTSIAGFASGTQTVRGRIYARRIR